ncbi:MFS transporter [Haliscomenobacter sp.]|uniref:MFS transporter n=1 Tax=Haliscomenobacter sp. TaxID=2717303 RepID=UPI003BAB1975
MENHSLKNTNVGAFALCMLSYLLAGTVSTLMSTYLPVAIPEILGKTVDEAKLGQIGAYLSTAFLVGWMLGGLCLGVIGDKIGRIKTLAFAIFLYGFFTLLTVFVGNWETLLFYRFLAGVGVGGVLLISTVYISEIWPENSRPIALGILAVSFPIGIVLTGSIGVLFAYWRSAFWLGFIPMFLAVVLLLFIPESEQWHQAKPKLMGGTESIFSGTYKRRIVLGSVIFGSVLIGLWAIFSWFPTWIQSLLGKGVDGQQERGLSMMLLGLGGIAGGVVSGFLIKKLGSRNTLMLTFAGCFVACCLLFLTNTRFSPIIYFETALLSLFFGISQGALSSYIPELFPINIRATATGFCFNIGRFFTATAVFFVGSLVTFFGGFGNALLSFSLTFLLALLVAFSNREPESLTASTLK